MDELFNLLQKVFSHYGILGVAFVLLCLFPVAIVCFLIWERRDERKEKPGLSLSDVNSRVEGVIRHHSALQNKVDKHLETYGEDKLEIMQMRTEVIHLKDGLDEHKQTTIRLVTSLEENQKDAFKLISEVKNHLMK